MLELADKISKTIDREERNEKGKKNMKKKKIFTPLLQTLTHHHKVNSYHSICSNKLYNDIIP